MDKIVRVSIEPAISRLKAKVFSHDLVAYSKYFSCHLISYDDMQKASHA